MNQLHEVKGTIRLADGSPASGLEVSAFDRDLRSEYFDRSPFTDYFIKVFWESSSGC